MFSRCLRAGVTFGGAAVIRGDLTPECAAAVRAVLESLGKKRGPEDERTEPQRFHDALQEGCELLPRARLGEDGYLSGKDAETAACDAQTVPVVTGHPVPAAGHRLGRLHPPGHSPRGHPAR